MKIIYQLLILISITVCASCGSNVGSSLGDYTVAVQNISLNKTSTNILIDGEENLYASFTPEDASNQTLLWTSSDESVACVSNEGIVKGKSLGLATIRVYTSEGDFTAHCEVIVSSAKTAVSGVSLNKKSLELDTSETETLFADILPQTATEQDLVWTSSDDNIAEVTMSGHITAKSSGTAKITVRTIDGGFLDSCEIVVHDTPVTNPSGIPVTGISLNKEELYLAIETSELLVASVEPINARNQNIIWKSHSPEIVDISSTGLVTAKSAGYALITAKSAEGSFVKTCCVYVTGSSEFSATPDGTSTVYITPGGIPCKMIKTPELLFAGQKFPTNVFDSVRKKVPSPFFIAETETTYALWREVYNWATDDSRGTHIYTFSGEGLNGGDHLQEEVSFDYPATTMTWRDAIVWCNALTEYYNANNGNNDDLRCVYYSDTDFTNPLRTAYNETYIESYNVELGSFDNPYVDISAKGFRLPESAEWEFAARYIGATKPENRNIVPVDGIFYTNGNSASGALAEYTDATATSFVAVTRDELTTPYIYPVKVKTKKPNALCLYDMSGNVEEFCFDWGPSSTEPNRIAHGGSVLFTTSPSFTTGFYSTYKPYHKNSFHGFRFIRSN